MADDDDVAACTTGMLDLHVSTFTGANTVHGVIIGCDASRNSEGKGREESCGEVLK